MSRPADPYVEHCIELLGSLGSVRAKRMFGGHGIYVDDLFIAIVTGEQLYLKADAAAQPAFAAAGCHPFAYTAKGRPMTMAYWTAPDEALDSPVAMRPWARLAIESALRARTVKPASRRPRQTSR